MRLYQQAADSPPVRPSEYKRGWWRISDGTNIDQLVNAMHNRGIRERPLKNKILTCKDTIIEACELVSRLVLGAQWCDGRDWEGSRFR